MMWELHPKQAALSRALYVVRLRHGPFRSGGRWYRRSVAQRRENNERELRRLKTSTGPPWHPPEGRESPREALMDDRRSMTHYAHAGRMRFLHGKAPPLVGRALLYLPMSTPTNTP